MVCVISNNIWEYTFLLKVISYVFRIVRVGLIQTHIVRPTSDQLKEQREAIFDRVAKLVEAAAYCGVNIICFQELWLEFY